MKKTNLLILFLFAVLSAVSCLQKDGGNPLNGRCTLRVAMPDGFDTKVNMGEIAGNRVSQVWSKGDRIAVVKDRGTASMKMSVYELVGEGGSSEGEFEYVSGHADVRGKVEVVYPVEAAYGYSIPHSQEYAEENYDPKSVVMSWHSENGIAEENIVLENESALLCLRYTGESAEKISRIRVKIEVADGHYDTYVLSVDPAVELSSDPSVFYISIPSVAQSSDIIFETVLADGSMMSITSKDRIFESGVIYRFPVMEYVINSQDSGEQEGYDIYLCIGQSNMAGRGEIKTEDKGVRDGVYLLDGEGNIVPGEIPFNIYSTIRGRRASQRFGLHNVFADEIHAYTGRKILLVVNARGGTSIPSWLKGAAPVIRSEERNDDEELWGLEVPGFYDEAIRRTLQAMKYGTLKGILWHQGEGDSYETSASLYPGRLKSLVTDLRADLGVDESIPFVLGETSEVYSRAYIINSVLRQCAEEIPNAFCVTSENCETQSDNVHFTRSGYITLGKRYSSVILREVYRIEAN